MKKETNMKFKSIFKHDHSTCTCESHTNSENPDCLEVNVFNEDDRTIVTTNENPEKAVIETEIKEDSGKIQTIPLDAKELDNLVKNGYDRARSICNKTYIIEKLFVGYVDSPDPTNPGRKPVRVKRVAEIRAASLKHALNMIGWDGKNVTLAGVVDDSQGNVEIQVNGKIIGKLNVSDRPDFSKLSGGQQNVERKVLTEMAKNSDCFKEYSNKLLADNSKSLEVLKVIYVPNRYVNMVVKKAKQLATCQCCTNNVETKEGE